MLSRQAYAGTDSPQQADVNLSMFSITKEMSGRAFPPVQFKDFAIGYG